MQSSILRVYFGTQENQVNFVSVGFGFEVSPPSNELQRVREKERVVPLS